MSPKEYITKCHTSLLQQCFCESNANTLGHGTSNLNCHLLLILTWLHGSSQNISAPFLLLCLYYLSKGCKFPFKWRSLLEGSCTFSVHFYRQTSSWWSCHHWWEWSILWWQATEKVKWERSQEKTWKEWQAFCIWHHAFDLMRLLLFQGALVWIMGMTLQFQVGSVSKQCWSKHRKMMGTGYSWSPVSVKVTCIPFCLSSHLLLLTIF